MKHGGGRSHYRGPGKGPEAKSAKRKAPKGPAAPGRAPGKPEFPNKHISRSTGQLDEGGFAKSKPALAASSGGGLRYQGQKY